MQVLSSPSGRKPRAAVSSFSQGALLLFIRLNIVLASILVKDGTLLVYIQKQIKSLSLFLTNCHEAKPPLFCPCAVNRVNLIIVSLVSFCQIIFPVKTFLNSNF